jgi:hypothetical protein
MNRAELYEQEIRTELALLRAELDKLKARADQEKLEQSEKFDRYLEALAEKSEEVGEKLEILKDSGSDAVDDIRTGLTEAWERLAIAKQAAKARFH